jgi:hypothetical protein
MNSFDTDVHYCTDTNIRSCPVSANSRLVVYLHELHSHNLPCMNLLLNYTQYMKQDIKKLFTLLAKIKTTYTDIWTTSASRRQKTY